jgi:hypothetical protein
MSIICLISSLVGEIALNPATLHHKKMERICDNSTCRFALQHEEAYVIFQTVHRDEIDA